jgi:hypothetical protein
MAYQTAVVCGIVGVGLEFSINDVILSMMHRSILFWMEVKLHAVQVWW